ncbi:MAG TPA: DUF5908 family protein [Burkholderiales bacterium]|nr:DUF5908 family protein [Burkholderiales bacterium]
MPVIVDEIVISVEVAPQDGAAGAPAAAAGGTPDAQRAFLAECVERVLDVLARREEP